MPFLCSSHSCLSSVSAFSESLSVFTFIFMHMLHYALLLCCIFYRFNSILTQWVDLALVASSTQLTTHLDGHLVSRHKCMSWKWRWKHTRHLCLAEYLSSSCFHFYSWNDIRNLENLSTKHPLLLFSVIKRFNWCQLEEIFFGGRERKNNRCKYTKDHHNWKRWNWMERIYIKMLIHYQTSLAPAWLSPLYHT